MQMLLGGKELGDWRAWHVIFGRNMAKEKSGAKTKAIDSVGSPCGLRSSLRQSRMGLRPGSFRTP